MVVVIVKRRKDTNQLNNCGEDYQNMKDLMRAAEYVKPPGLD